MQPFDLTFGSLLAYCPSGTNAEAAKAREVKNYVKNERTFEGPPKQTMSERVAEMVSENINSLPFKHFFGRDVSFVPVPSSGLILPGGLWVPERISSELSKKGLGVNYPCLERLKPVAKSSLSKPSDRPSAIDHYNSIGVKSLVQQPKTIVLVDDVVTRGSTFIGCAYRLKEKFPGVPIVAFAAMRAVLKVSDFKTWRDPCVGKIKLYKSGKTFREP